MISKIDDITHKILKLLGFKKFMLGHVLGLMLIVILSVRGAYRLLLKEKLGQAVGNVIVPIALYIGIRLLQRIWIDRGAEDRFLYFFIGRSKTK